MKANNKTNNKLKNKALIKLAYCLYPTLLMSAVLLFIVFMVLGFCVKSEVVSNVMFALSFACLILYIPTFIYFSKIQNLTWYKMCVRCKNLKIVEKQVNENKLKKLEEIKKHFSNESNANTNKQTFLITKNKK